MPEARSVAARLLPSLAAVVGIVATAYLGSWQLDRAAYKTALQDRLDLAARQPPVHLPAQPVFAESIGYQHVEAQGEFRPDLTIFLDNRVHDGVVGYEVVTPLRLAPDLYVLVNRGWVQAPRTRDKLPDVSTPGGVVQVEGTALPPSKRYLELSAQTVAGSVWQNLSIDRYAAQYKLRLQPVVIQQHNDLGDHLVRDWGRPDTGVDKHRAYALQWFVMSAAILAIYIGFHVRRKAKKADGEA